MAFQYFTQSTTAVTTTKEKRKKMLETDRQTVIIEISGYELANFINYIWKKKVYISMMSLELKLFSLSLFILSDDEVENSINSLKLFSHFVGQVLY